MTQNLSPVPGLIVICDYKRDFSPPEMVNRRLAVVVCARLPQRDPKLCTILPLSLTPAPSGVLYQCKVTLPIEVPGDFPGTIKWAKADMLTTVSCDRLSLPYEKPPWSKRVYKRVILPPAEMTKVRKALLHALGFATLTDQL